MNTLLADMQLSAARALGWMPGLVQVSPTEIRVEGWALRLWDRAERPRFLINGEDFAEVAWPLPAADLHEVFPALLPDGSARFRARHPLTPETHPFPGGFARFNVTGRLGEHRHSYRTAWFLADPAGEPPVPTPERITRVIGSPDTFMFLLGGATIAQRIQHLLQDRFDRPLNSFRAILDWGCGAGRVTRYLGMMASGITGVDIDPDNLQQCAASLPEVVFHQVGLYPPTDFPDGRFDLVIGLSVLTHLKESAQDQWLAELRRLVEPGGILLLSVQGLAQSALYRAPVERQERAHREGFLYVGPDGQLDNVVAEAGYYSHIIQSPEYIMVHWGRYFDVLDIVEGIAGNQDLVVLRRPR